MATNPLECHTRHCSAPALTDEGFVLCYEHLDKQAAVTKVRLLQRNEEALKKELWRIKQALRSFNNLIESC